MKITIAGYGVLGKAHEAVLKHKNEVSIADPELTGKTVQDFADTAEGVVCCVSTPPRHNGACDMTNVYEVVNQTKKTTPILIKSTISIEGWQMLKETFPEHDLTFSPEFLRAASAERDLWNTSFMLMGGSNPTFWHDLFGKTIHELNVGVVDPEILIVGKYFRNAFLATKVSFFNQLFDYCQAKKIDYNVVAQVVGVDPRIGGSHTAITDERGWGGHCFPKDMSAIVYSAEKEGVDLSLIRESITYNKKIRKQ
jgi:UDPglucose 6-dehydrogenase